MLQLNKYYLEAVQRPALKLITFNRIINTFIDLKNSNQRSGFARTTALSNANIILLGYHS